MLIEGEHVSVNPKIHYVQQDKKSVKDNPTAFHDMWQMMQSEVVGHVKTMVNIDKLENPESRY